MKIGIVAPRPADAGIVGGAERLWGTLRARLVDRGHDVDLVTLPTPESTFVEVLDSYEQFTNLDVERFDVVITGKYPAWMINHPRHVVYLLHPLRGLYDTYPIELGGDIPALIETALANAVTPTEVLDLARQFLDEDVTRHAFPGPFARAVVRRLDHLAYASVARFAAISEEVACRPDYFPEEPILVVHPESDLAATCLAQPLLPPPPHTVFVAAGRLDRPKRFDLVLEAFAFYPDRNARLIIAGDGPDRSRLERVNDGDARVRFVGRVPDDELCELYRNATTVVFTPLHEDFGYISSEAMAAGTPIITTTDSGGAKELVEHGVNGLVLDPDPRRIAWGMGHIAGNPFLRWQMGLNARRRAAAVRFDPLIDLVERLPLERSDEQAASSRRRALVLSTYPIDPMIGGGQRRLRHLTRSLAERVDVTVLVSSAKTDRVNPGVAGQVVANGVDTEALALKTPAQAGAARSELLGIAGFDPTDPRPIAVFIGSWHLPNVDAARLILEVAERRVDWIFILAGSHTSEFAPEPVPDNVHLIAVFVESLLWPLLAGATAALNPMVSGGGSNLKLFDYLSVGTPVITTEVGARGLDQPALSVLLCEPTVAGLDRALVDFSRLEAGTVEISTDEISTRVAHGRNLVEEQYDWRQLGATWADGVLAAASIDVPPAAIPPRSRSAPIILAEGLPPPHDPIEATMRAVGRLARNEPPTPKEATVDPLIQERLEHAAENRYVGRRLPATARFRLPKQALIRVGQVISNEQVNYNEAVLDAISRLATTVEVLRKENLELRDRLDLLSADPVEPA